MQLSHFIKIVIGIMRSIKIVKKIIVLTFALLVLFLFLYYFVLGFYPTSVELDYVVVHFDLKGAPPKLHYLESLLPKLKELGVNGILMEYEDMFPYEEKLVNLSARNCYEKNELSKFLLKTVRSGIEVIPLVQTFGHMEHALKLQEFKYLREQSKYPDSICPSKPDSIELIQNMLEQVINFHTRIAPLKHIHIGCDEVLHINECNECRRNNNTNTEIFLNHVNIVNRIVTKISPHTTVLIWDDMLRGKANVHINTIDFKNIEPVCWDYETKLTVTYKNLYNYHLTFSNIWIASAFKGADGITATFPNFINRFGNNLSWLQFILNCKFGGINFKGIILTGWSRYSHMDPLCELLPNSMPSLILNLILIKSMKKGIVYGDSFNLELDEYFDKYLRVEFNNYFKCNYLFYSDFDNSGCKFETSKILTELLTYNAIMSEIKWAFKNDDTVLPSIEYYSKIKTLNVNSINYCMLWCQSIIKKIEHFKTKLRMYMSPFFEADTVDEYISYKTFQSEKRIRNTLKILKRYLSIHSWERRPLKTNISYT